MGLEFIVATLVVSLVMRRLAGMVTASYHLDCFEAMVVTLPINYGCSNRVKYGESLF